MTSTLAGTSSGDELAPAAPASAPTRGTAADVTALDLLAGGALALLALLAWVSLALAHLGAHSLAAVLALTATAVLLLGFRLRRALRGRVRADHAGVLVAVAAAAVAAALTFPGFSYGVADKDPGGYVAHAVEIARTGDYAFTDQLLHDQLPVQLASPGARFPGVWVRDAATGRIVPQFYHLWPALLATAYDVDGYDGLRFTGPFVGVLAVLCVVALLRRVGSSLGGPRAGIVAAAAGGLLLATNMLEVWQARFPTTEVLAEALYLGALLGIVVSLQTRSRTAAAFAGLLVGVGWLNRADGLLLVLLAVGAGATLVVIRRWDARATWFTAGLAAVAPHALLQAYDLAHNYSAANSIPSLPKVAAVVLGCFGLAAVLRLLARRPVAWLVAGPLVRRRTQRAVGIVVCAAAAALLLLGFLRPRLFGMDYFHYNHAVIRSYDEQILHRLSWFFTLPGFVLMGLGLAAVALRRWRPSAWAVTLPTLVLFPVYAYSARNSTRLMWWTRRYVPTVLPGIVILIALAIGVGYVALVRGRPLWRVPALAAAAALVTAFLAQSLPLRSHDEWKGSFAVTQALADLSPGHRGLFLWEPVEEEGCCTGPTQLFATPLWLEHADLSVLLPMDPTARTQRIQIYARHFPGRPLFVVGERGALPAGIDPGTVQPVWSTHVALPMWDESDTSRPTGSHPVPVDIAVWRVVGT